MKIFMQVSRWIYLEKVHVGFKEDKGEEKMSSRKKRGTRE